MSFGRASFGKETSERKVYTTSFGNLIQRELEIIHTTRIGKILICEWLIWDLFWKWG